jgi:hypothetical protein
MRVWWLLLIPSLLSAQTYRGILRYPTKTDTVVLTLEPLPECATPKAAWIWCDDFEVDRLQQYAQVANAAGNFGRIAGIGREQSIGIRSTFNPAIQNGGWLEVTFGRTPPVSFFRKPVDAGTAKYRQIYWRIFVRTDTDWTGGNADKFTRASVYANANRAQAMIAHAWGGGRDVFGFYLDPARGTDAAGNLRSTRWNDFANLTWLGNFKAATSLLGTNGAWECVEFMVKLNDAGQSNGEFWYWKNGIAEASRTNLNWLGAYTEYGINSVRIEQYWPAAPRIQSRYFDNFVVSTERIGCN